MSTFSVYDKATGMIKSHFTGSVRQLAINVPDGHGWIEGRFDPLCRRVEGDEVVAYQPARPDEDHDWDQQSERWVKRDAIVDREMHRAAALKKILELEEKQHRRVRELLASEDPQLKAIDEEIARERQRINDNSRLVDDGTALPAAR